MKSLLKIQFMPQQFKPRFWGCTLMVWFFLVTAPRTFALYLPSIVTAQRVPNGSITVDGKPEIIWADVAAKSEPATLLFSDYQKIVLLLSDNIRNADPGLYFKAPNNGSVTMLSAYDNTALYFFFIVKENNVFNPSSLCATTTNLSAAHAPVVFVDPSPWTTTDYGALFSKDGSGLVFGTSPKTIEIAKPIFAADNRVYFRNRVAPQDRFEVPSILPNSLSAVSARHSTQDPLTYGVEMKIPFWSGKVSDFNPGSSMFISWGYNHYPDSVTTNCDADPIAYRWAKHYKAYAPADAKPAGWRVGDSTHYDPTRSWDGWGRFFLNTNLLSTSDCRTVDMTVWDLTQWKIACTQNTTSAIKRAIVNTPEKLGQLKNDHSNYFDLRGKQLTNKKPTLLGAGF